MTRFLILFVILFSCFELYPREPDSRQFFRLTDFSTELSGGLFSLRINDKEVAGFPRFLKKNDIFSFDYSSGDEITVRVHKTKKKLTVREKIIQVGEYATEAIADRMGDYEILRPTKHALSRRIEPHKSISSDLLLERSSSTQFALIEMFHTKLESAAHFLCFEPFIPEGKYQIILKRSLIAPDDVDKCGGTPEPRKFIERSNETVFNFLLKSNGIYQEYRSGSISGDTFFNRFYSLGGDTFKQELNVAIRQKWERLDQWIIVTQNGETVFDSRVHKQPQGTEVDWGNPEFTIDWKKNDRITVEFRDYNKYMNDTLIFSKTSDGPYSISMLSGSVRGGVSSTSRIFFELKYMNVGQGGFADGL